MYRCGHCIQCKRLMSSKWLNSIEYCEGHLVPGEIHHKLLCVSCEAKAKQLDEVFEGDFKKGRKFNRKTINMRKIYSLFQGIVKSLKVMIVFSVAALLLGLKPEIKEITIGGGLLLVLNFIKIRWNIKIPWIE